MAEQTPNGGFGSRVICGMSNGMGGGGARRPYGSKTTALMTASVAAAQESS
jgi:hypothetical protein